MKERQRSPEDGNGNQLQYSCLGNSHGQRSMAGYSPWGPKESDMAERLTHSLSLIYKLLYIRVCPGSTSGKESACQCRRSKRCGFDSWVGKIPWGRAWQLIPVILHGESHGQRSLAGCSPYGRTEAQSQTQLKWLSTTHTLACVSLVDQW